MKALVMHKAATVAHGTGIRARALTRGLKALAPERISHQKNGTNWGVFKWR